MLARDSALKWLLLAAIALIDALWIGTSDFHLVAVGIAGPAASALLLVGAACFFRFVRRDAALFALLEAIAQIIVCFAVCGVLSYLVIAANHPLVDQHLSAIDYALGFDWPRFVRWIQAHPVFDGLLRIAYRSSVVQMFVIALLLSYRQAARVRELSGTIVISLILTIAISGMLPAESAYPYYGPAHPDIVPEIAVRDLFLLRDGSLRSLDLRMMDGLICFPSFHVVLSLLFIYVLRASRLLLPLGLALNLTVIVSTLTAGGHYLVDLFGGALVAALAIALYRAVSARPSAAMRRRQRTDAPALPA
jgi:membrane-associated phospholipid phosphatase